MPRNKVIIIKAFIFTGQYMLPGDVRHEIRPIRMRYLQSDFFQRYIWLKFRFISSLCR